ncbi:hypothetical protein J5288_08615 [Agrobacterium sp. S2/73]|uniref:hypothetical protein n=1 Tax=unclassified Agrobacterium TaxID=2632611 RepID=UPI001ADA8A01|nr:MULTISPECIES: hypothetical protein [unclassified Agrobacterium]MBO9108764.1 hypothetical protein [Agrobacterium sp. S2/73]QXZ73479.1 hypothetical protein J5276_05895 [Agrobacterium sp. S7/73]
MNYIVAFDPSKYTGWALRDIYRHDSAIRCGVFEVPVKSDQYFTADQIGQKVHALIAAEDQAGRKPTFAILEEQSMAKIGNSSADGMIYPWISSAAIVAVLSNWGIPYATIPTASWRVAFFGSGFKPPFKIHKLKKPDPKTGKLERIENLWKEACVSECERRGIVVPGNKSISHNAAEACALALCGQSDKTKIHAGRYEAAWNAIKDTKFKRAPSGDLFAGSGA